MNKSILNPYDLPADGLSTLRLMRKMFEQLSVSKENPNGFLGPNDRALFMFLSGMSPSIAGEVKGYSVSGAPVIRPVTLTSSEWVRITCFMRSPLSGNDPLEQKLACKEISDSFAAAGLDWLSRAAGSDLGEYFFMRGLLFNTRAKSPTLFDHLNQGGGQLSRAEIDVALNQKGRS
tara:strand:+ start:1411 stop:1938 length:528 start_codon:yes stop_codon:yes gene_type:complete